MKGVTVWTEPGKWDDPAYLDWLCSRGEDDPQVAAEIATWPADVRKGWDRDGILRAPGVKAHAWEKQLAGLDDADEDEKDADRDPW